MSLPAIETDAAVRHVSVDVPLPPRELREIVGPLEDRYYENRAGDPLWGPLDIGPLAREAAYRRVFDFGCGCGRQARQLLQQRTPPERYVGLDINRACVTWCREHLARPGVEFHLHDVWNRVYAPENTQQPYAPIRGYGHDFTIINAHSVFTHLYEHQSAYYLNEFAKMLDARGIVRTTWLFFNRVLFPCLAPHQHCIYLQIEDPTQAVYYDWSFFLELMRATRFKIVKVVWSQLMGFQHEVYLARGPEFDDISDALHPINVPGY
jgi:SAM-dependent methyltransferase